MTDIQEQMKLFAEDILFGGPPDDEIRVKAEILATLVLQVQEGIRK
jgi:hypothetical protein